MKFLIRTKKRKIEKNKHKIRTHDVEAIFARHKILKIKKKKVQIYIHNESQYELLKALIKSTLQKNTHEYTKKI